MKVKLTGTCNQCGLCCYIGEFRCINLIVSGKPGEPMASKCGAYNSRYDGMPIVLVDPNGKTRMATCSHGSELEDLEIFERGIGKGCSMVPVFQT